MFETYRMLGRERELELEAEAARLRPLAGRPLLHRTARTSAAEKETQRKERTMSITRLIARLRISSAALVTLVVSVAVVGQAAAEVWPEGRYGAKLGTQVEARVLAPDDVRRALPVRSTPAPPDFVDRFVQRQRMDLGSATQSASTPQQHGEAFDWGAAGIGASTTAALLLALGVGVGISRRSRTRSAVA